MRADFDAGAGELFAQAMDVHFNRIVADFLVDQNMGYDANDTAATGQRGIGNGTHKANVGPAIDKPGTALG